MTQSITCTWSEGMAFDTVVSGHTIRLDGDESVGGKDTGPRPKTLLLSSLAGCTAMDVIYMLRKMRIEPTFFNVRVEGELSEEHPKVFTKIRLVYEFRKSDGLDTHKVETAVGLSQEKYCGVSAMLKAASELDYEIVYLD
jgi:putative redox protein